MYDINVYFFIGLYYFSCSALPLIQKLQAEKAEMSVQAVLLVFLALGSYSTVKCQLTGNIIFSAFVNQRGQYNFLIIVFLQIQNLVMSHI